MNIFSALFGGNNPAPAAAPAAQPTTPAQPAAGQPGQINPNTNPATAATPGTAPNGVVPDGAATPPASPLDQFTELWKPSENNGDPQPLINVDPKALAEAAKKTDFTKMISPEQLTAIGQGGEAAVAAFAQAMNSVAQGVYAQSAFATTKIVQQAVNKAREQFQAELPAHVKKLNVSENLRGENPAFSHPAASPILGALEIQLTQKHPNASASEITQMAKQYLESFAGAVNAPKAAAEAEASRKATNAKETDWNTFL